MSQPGFYDIKDLGELPDDNNIESGSTKRPYNPQNSPSRKKRNRRNIIIVISVLVLVLVIAAGGYVLLKKQSKKITKQQTKTTLQNNQPTTTSPVVGGMETYTAQGSDLNLSFQYPQSWRVTPPTNTDTTNQPITLTSPITTITTADNSQVSGEVVLTIAPGTNEVAALNSNNPVAALASSQFAYTNPTSSQYKYPYLSFIHFSNGQKVNGAFEATLVSGVLTFSPGEPITNASLTGLDPVVMASFYTCTNNNKTCAATSVNKLPPLSITSAIWSSQQIFLDTQQILASFQFN